MSTVVVSIKDGANAASVVSPMLSVESSKLIMNCKELMGLYREKLAHEEPFANCTSDMVAHI